MGEILEDCKSERLRGYGEVHGDAKPELDRAGQGLIDALGSFALFAKN